MRRYTVKVILKESITILFIAAIISSLGGLTIENVRTMIYTIVPLLIIFPALNDMTGDYGSIISSRFTTIIYMRGIPKKWWKDKEIKNLFSEIFKTSILSSIYVALLSCIIALIKNYPLTLVLVVKILFISVLTTIFISTFMFVVSIVLGIWFFKRKIDPDNVLIPVTTGIADFLSMIVLLVLIKVLF